MRLLPFIFVLAVAGCSKTSLSTQATEATAQVQRWVPVGTPLADALRGMEQRGFACSVVTNGSFAELRGVDYLYCDRSEGGVTRQRWQAALVLVEGKVSIVRVTTGSQGL